MRILILLLFLVPGFCEAQYNKLELGKTDRVYQPSRDTVYIRDTIPVFLIDVSDTTENVIIYRGDKKSGKSKYMTVKIIERGFKYNNQWFDQKKNSIRILDRRWRPVKESILKRTYQILNK